MVPDLPQRASVNSRCFLLLLLRVHGFVRFHGFFKEDYLPRTGSRAKPDPSPIQDEDWKTLLAFLVILREGGNSPNRPTPSKTTSYPPYEEFRAICRKHKVPYSLRSASRG